MSDQIAIRLSGVGKMYKLYPNRTESVLDAIGLTALMPWRQKKSGEFWALRDINLELKVGSRLGIIGRNGAGKSTLLKLITGNLAPSEGQVVSNGRVQALLEAGAGFHPEFTGYENVRAALTFQGMAPNEIAQATQEIEEFSELGRFLSLPFKTYSTGMQARLIFATATSLKPEILIIDEVLGAGDAYFAAKSAERMKGLVEESGASILLVTHGLSDITRYCDECIWLDRGRIVMRGPSLEIVKAYEEFVHQLDNQRLKAKNRKRWSGNDDPSKTESYDDSILLSFQLEGEFTASCDITEVAFLAGGQAEETLKVGSVQDTNQAHRSFVVIEGGRWSAPRRVGEQWCRSLEIKRGASTNALGNIGFYSYALLAEIRYAFQVRYRCNGSAKLFITITRNGSVLVDHAELSDGRRGWSEQLIALEGLARTPSLPTSKDALPRSRASFGETRSQSEQVIEEGTVSPTGGALSVTRWTGEGSLIIEKVVLLGESGQEQAVFHFGNSQTLSLTIRAQRSGSYALLPTATLHRLDGVFVTNFIGPVVPLDLTKDEGREFRLVLDSLNLGDHEYVYSIAIYEKEVSDNTRYDLLDRSYQFKVVGNSLLLAQSVFSHPAKWQAM